jgi:hypothetical protein
MSHCPLAVWHPVGYDGGAYTGGPFRIVHHTTQGSTAEAALVEFMTHQHASHFLVDDTTIYQLIDTSRAACALKHTGNPQTNRLSAIQIELVGFAEHPKHPAALSNLRRLLRALEQEFNIPRLWPNGFPIPANNGHDPGGHNRDPFVWAARGGHYGHEHVPQNVHWDPAYTQQEVVYLMSDPQVLADAMPQPQQQPAPPV